MAGILHQHRDAIPKPLLGIATWNLVPQYDPEPSSPQSPDPCLQELVRTVLDLDVDTASKMRGNPRYDVFPPYPDQLILDSRYVPRQHPKQRQQRPGQHEVQARLEICVPTSKDQPPSFDCLRMVADPRTWSACGLFWSQIEDCDPRSIVKRPASKRSIKAHLSLPGEKSTRAQPLTLKILAFNDNPLQTHIKFETGQNSLVKACRGYITVQKEPGLPGGVRIINQKVVQFATAELQQRASQTLKYWLQAETACLVMRF